MLPKKPTTLLPLRAFPTLMHLTKLENTLSSENTTNQLPRITSFSSMNSPFLEIAIKKSPLNALMDGSSQENGTNKLTIKWLNALKKKPDALPISINFHKQT